MLLFALTCNSLKNGQSLQCRLNNIEASEVGCEHSLDANEHLSCIFIKYLLFSFEFVAREVRKLAPRSIHAKALPVERLALLLFVVRRHVLLQLDLGGAVGEGTPLAEGALILCLPVFADLGALFLAVAQGAFKVVLVLD